MPVRAHIARFGAAATMFAFLSIPCPGFALDKSIVPCQVTDNATIEATICTAGGDGELWEYKGTSGGNVSLHIKYLRSPTGDVSGTLQVDPGEISYAICEANAAGFFSLPSHLESTDEPVMLHAPKLHIAISRVGSTKTVDVYDPSHIRNQPDVARFLRV